MSRRFCETWEWCGHATGLRPQRPQKGAFGGKDTSFDSCLEYPRSRHFGETWGTHISYTINYTRPWSSIALATFRKPPMLAPFTRFPGVPYFSAVSKQFWWMAIMILCRRSSTSWRVQLSRALFWAISSPDVATPPALAALAGPYRTLASRNILVASSVLGMFAPSATNLQPFFSRFAASFAVISFCVALGKAQSALMFHSGLCSSLMSVGMKMAFLNLSA